LCHLWFESVHPFDDGNGRIGRAIVDMALAQDDGSSQRLYGMSRQLMREREAYYSQLEQAQRGSLDVTPWVQWFLDQFRLACVASQQVIEQAVDKSRFWKEHAATAINKRQRKALLKMLEAGNGGFAGGMSASKYGSVTRTSKATATRDLAELERNGLLTTSGQGRSTRYWVNIPEWKIALSKRPTTRAAGGMNDRQD
jgi:Fic family protein